jgi:hypothetical protein
MKKKLLIGYYGYYENGSLKCKICDPGYYCDGYYRISCPRGSYCPNPGSNPIPCPAGSYCTYGSIKPKPCPIGSYTNAPSKPIKTRFIYFLKKFFNLNRSILVQEMWS